MSGSMQFDTACYGCYEPYEWAANNSEDWFEQPPPAPADPDFSIDYPNPAYIHRIPTDHLPSTPYQSGGTAGVGSNQGRLCYGRDSPVNDAEYYTISGASFTLRIRHACTALSACQGAASGLSSTPTIALLRI
jgi:hypothetical protein